MSENSNRYFDKVRLLDGSVAEVRDAFAREKLVGVIKYLGVTSTSISDGSANPNVVIDGETIDVSNGNIVVYGTREFIYLDADHKWHEFGHDTTYSNLTFEQIQSGINTEGRVISAKVFSDVIQSIISYIDNSASGSNEFMRFIGITSTNITDGSTNLVVDIDGEEHAGYRGDIVISGDKEYICTGTQWKLLGYDTIYEVLTIAQINTGSDTAGKLISAKTLKDYINQSITNVMHFQGSTTTALTDGSTTATIVINGDDYNPVKGDVVLNNGKEFVWTGTSWELLGDEGSYALKSSTVSVVKDTSYNPSVVPTLQTQQINIPVIDSVGTSPTLTITNKNIPNVTNVGSPSNYSVLNGILQITPGQAPTLGTDISVGSSSEWNAGTLPSFGSDISVNSVSQWNSGSPSSLTVERETVVKP